MIFSLASSASVFAQNNTTECSLNDIASSPLQSWQDTINTLSSALRKEADTVTCDTSSSINTNSKFTDYVRRVVPLDSAASLMKEIYSLSSSGTDFFFEIDQYFDQAGPVLELKPHTASIEQTERNIIETAQYVGSHCAQSVEIKNNILPENSSYDTTGRTISEILVAMAKQTKEVKRFYQTLSQGIQTEEYQDEIPFLLAPLWFSKNMYIYYSPVHIQECRDNDPRRLAFLDVLKWAFTSGWKYPQAIQVWKDAMALLLYRWGQLAGVWETDNNKENEIQRIVKARIWGIGNSDIVINSQFFKEFGYRPNTRTIEEKQLNSEQKPFYVSFWYEFLRKVVPSLVSQAKENNTNYIKSNQTQEEIQKIERLQYLEEWLYAQYDIRKKWVALIQEKNPKTATELIQLVEESKERQSIMQNIYKNICHLLWEQASNIAEAWRCK